MANIPLRKLTVAELLRQALDRDNPMCECIPELPENSQLEIEEITGNLIHFCLFFLSQSDQVYCALYHLHCNIFEP